MGKSHSKNFVFATELNAEQYEAYLNWGVFLAKFAKQNNPVNAERLYWESIEKFKRVVELKPDNYTAFNNWGTSLRRIAEKKKGDEAEELFKEAHKLYNRAIEYGSGHYNIACFYIVRNDRKTALKYLETSLKEKNVTVDFVRSDDDWKSLIGDEDFIALLNKYKGASL